ncbi:MAG: neutral/alkaline non-lysosomal ceramidase N-terminal domain-containing protein [Planctomycetaceae bacterium]|nr:neutral/alkaline non-lysosomal ceramidase N-terminal domain-containing protein [Planctomycetaceae bacterium]
MSCRQLVVTLALVILIPFRIFGADSASETSFEFGFSKLEITPQEPIRLSGYGNRDQPYAGIDEPLFVRGMALRQGTEGPLHVLLSVDTIGFPGVLSKEIFGRVSQEHSLSRSRFVVCCTHSHTAPHIVRGLSNLFSTPLTAPEEEKQTQYTDFVRDICVQAVHQAVANLQPGQLQTASGEVKFARNRRVIKDGIWTGFGENPNGPVDHSLPVLRILSADGQRVRGLVFNYACHCTTFGGDYNRVNGDWAGYASKYLEQQHEGAIALCTIGCGADANPERESTRAFEIAQAQGQEISEEVKQLAEEAKWTAITEPPVATYGFAGLPINCPSVKELQEAAKNPRLQVRRHAEIMLDIKQRMGRLPESYPMPIQVWRFGNDFAMVFLGGEVCVDYALRIKRELAEQTTGLSEDRVWVTAYANDVFGYVAPERMQSEGGYEVDFSMIYYLQPGRWSSGTEEVILKRVHELFDAQQVDEPLSVRAALETFHLAEGYEIGIIAAEPLIRDPVNFALDGRGRLWVVEMGDYPRGDPAVAPEQVALTDPEAKRHHPWDGPAGGTIKCLTDTDGDGTFDKADLFLDGLAFPTGVFPWKDGVLVSGAPDIFFAKDTDGDGRADHREVLYTGFDEANPQHRVAGFEYGLDGWLYLSAGTNNPRIRCVGTGEEIETSRRDTRIHPQTGRAEAISGQSQYGRVRDDFNHWFGNTNSEPLFELVIEDGELRRNPFVASPSAKTYLTDPPVAPPVYPTSRTLDRFNDLFALNRFTSACSPHVFHGDVLVCEPVHNLVSRIVLERGDVALAGHRHQDEQQSEFLSSRDNWFRPVRSLTAPDGSLWICDMYRHVIEHPEWIPEAWQKKLNLYAGNDRGRIYRISRKGTAVEPIPNFAEMAVEELIDQLASDNRWRRDTAQRLLNDRKDELTSPLKTKLTKLAHGETTANPAVQTQALWTVSQLCPELVRWPAFVEGEPDVLANAVEAFGLAEIPQAVLFGVVVAHKSPRVRYQAALAAPTAEGVCGDILAELAVNSVEDRWIQTAILTSAVGVAEPVLVSVLRDVPESESRSAFIQKLIQTSVGDKKLDGLADILSIVDSAGPEWSAWRLDAVRTCLPDGRKASDNSRRIVDSALAAAVRFSEDDNTPLAQRIAAIRLLEFSEDPSVPSLLTNFLSPQTPPEIQTAVVPVLAVQVGPERLIDALPSSGPSVQREIISVLTNKADRIKALLDRISDGTVSPLLIDPATRQALSIHPSPDIQHRARQVLETEADRDVESLLTEYLAAQADQSDSGRGRVLFEKNCATCHQHRGIGKAIGPPLANLQNKSPEFVITSVLDPSRAVESKYRSYAIATMDGKTYAGMVLAETATSIQLVQSNGQTLDILRKDIDEMIGSPKSFMPEGFAKLLSPQDLHDIAAFVLARSQAE